MMRARRGVDSGLPPETRKANPKGSKRTAGINRFLETGWKKRSDPGLQSVSGAKIGWRRRQDEGHREEGGVPPKRRSAFTGRLQLTTPKKGGGGVHATGAAESPFNEDKGRLRDRALKGKEEGLVRKNRP